MIPKPAKRGRKPPKRIQRKKRPAPLRKRASRGELRKLADDYMSLYVRHKAGWRCWVCGSNAWNEMQAAHLIGKGAHPVGRYIEENVRCLCAGCHKTYTHNPEDWRRLLEKRLGAEFVAELTDKCDVRGKHDYVAQILCWDLLLQLREDLDKIQERYDRLRARGVKLGVFEQRNNPRVSEDRS